jgi:RimJ/RimL family protein N-acetyltransferase
VSDTVPMAVLPEVPESTQRLEFRNWSYDDVPFVLDMYSRPDVCRFIGGNPIPAGDEDEAQARIARWNARTVQPHGLWAIVPTSGAFAGEPVGNLLFVPLPRSDGEPPNQDEIGWHLHPKARGMGFATEGAGSLIKRARAAGVARIHAVVDAENAASLRVCERLGMTRLGLTDEWYGQQVVDHLLEL